MSNAGEGNGGGENKQATFSVDMSIHEAMAVHPRVREVFAAFHLGGCAHCSVGAFETIGQVCEGYGIDSNLLLQVLEDLVADKPAQDAGATS
ncbi:MAG: disulfide oxidoreductase [Candidatus Hydrogenedentes bacterium]|nr:disulfide oxidoreductase [Candidatus Hydrogenedentota bacterium]